MLPQNTARLHSTYGSDAVAAQHPVGNKGSCNGSSYMQTGEQLHSSCDMGAQKAVIRG